MKYRSLKLWSVLAGGIPWVSRKSQLSSYRSCHVYTRKTMFLKSGSVVSRRWQGLVRGIHFLHPIRALGLSYVDSLMRSDDLACPHLKETAWCWRVLWLGILQIFFFCVLCSSGVGQPWMQYLFPLAAVTNYHQRGDWKQQKCILSQFWRWED